MKKAYWLIPALSFVLVLIFTQLWVDGNKSALTGLYYFAGLTLYTFVLAIRINRYSK